ncbi:MAG: hypothetical protein U5K28_08610 [Halobacteriales archaeon]|nr:hypothetical protein [Halobacteriales archaeon]
MNDDRLQFLSLYLVRFAGGFGLAALATLLPTYISLYDPSALLLGLFTSGYTLASTLAIVPFAWGGDAGDKRTALVSRHRARRARVHGLRVRLRLVGLRRCAGDAGLRRDRSLAALAVARRRARPDW